MAKIPDEVVERNEALAAIKERNYHAEIAAERDNLREALRMARESMMDLAKHANDMESQNHDYHALAEGQPYISQPLSNAYDALTRIDQLIGDKSDDA